MHHFPLPEANSGSPKVVLQPYLLLSVPSQPDGLQLYHHHRPVHHHFYAESFGEGGFVAPDGGAGWGGAALYGDGDEFVGAVAVFEVGQELAEWWQGDVPAGVAVAAVFGVA